MGKKVLFVMQYGYAGPECVLLARGLIEKGYEVTWLSSTLLPKGLRYRNLTQELPGKVIKCKPLFEFPGSYGLAFTPGFFKHLSGDYEFIVMINWYEIQFVQYKILGLFRKMPKLFIWSHITESTMPKNKVILPFFKAYLWASSRLIGRAKVGYPCDGARKVLERYGIKGSYPLAFSVNSKLFSPAKKEKSKTVKILFAGRLEEYKGIWDVIHAVESLSPSARKKAHLRIWGKGPLKEQILEYIKDKPYIELLDKEFRYEDVPKVYQDQDIFVLPTKVEAGGPLTGVEAASCGLPVIITPDNHPILVDGKTGFAVDPGSPKQIAKALEGLINSPQLLALMSKNALKKAKEFDYHKTAQEILRIMGD